MIRGHGGNIYEAAQAVGCSVDEIIDMSSNVNPLGPPPGLLAHPRHCPEIRKSSPPFEHLRQPDES